MFRLTEVSSHTVLWGQTLVYSAYCLAIIAVVAWLARRLTQPSGTAPKVPPKVFFSFVGLLIAIGVSLHVITYNTIPWVPQDLHGAPVAAENTYAITVADHEFGIPGGHLDVPCAQTVKFSVTSTDLTYGFGLFRPDNSMVTQMQVVPGHPNDLIWTFTEEGVFTIRSTEYSGPAGYQMIVKDALTVSGCPAAQAADEISKG